MIVGLLITATLYRSNPRLMSRQLAIFSLNIVLDNKSQERQNHYLLSHYQHILNHDCLSEAARLLFSRTCHLNLQIISEEECRNRNPTSVHR